MKELIQTPRNLRVAGITLALVALLIALVAIPNTVSPISAQDSEPTEACGPGKAPSDPATVYDSGHLLLFDAYWDTDEKVLHNNLCPAEYEVTTSSSPPFDNVETFTPTNIDVTETIIQVDDVYKHTLTHQDVRRYQFLEDDETEVGEGSTVWWLRLGDNTATPNVTESASDLQLGFFTGRFKSDNWARRNGETGAPLGYRYESVREDEDAEREHGHFYAFKPSEDDGEMEATWSSENAATVEIEMPAATDSNTEATKEFYEWVFTKPGEYLLDVHIRGYVSEGSAISEHDTESSEVVRYTFHVGPMIDLSVDLDATLTEASTSTDSDSVSYTVSAGNSGMDAATTAMVQVNLPEGLEYADGSASETVTHRDGTVAWDIGRLDADASTELTFTANVTSDGEGAKLTADAQIRDRTYNEIDRDPSNNADTAAVTPTSVTKNRPPRTVVSRQVHEQARWGTHVGEPIVLSDPDMDELNYSLSGRGSEDFHIGTTTGQITVAERGRPDYETKWSYVLWLDVNDGMGMASDGTATTSDEVDQSIEVRIALEDVEVDDVELLLQVSTTTQPALGQQVELRTTLEGSQESLSGISHKVYSWGVREEPNGSWVAVPGDHSSSSTIHRSHNTATSRSYYVGVTYVHDGRWLYAESNEVTVTWGN